MDNAVITSLSHLGPKCGGIEMRQQCQLSPVLRHHLTFQRLLFKMYLLFLMLWWYFYMKLVQYKNTNTHCGVLMTWCFSTRASVATVLIRNPYVSSYLWVNPLLTICFEEPNMNHLDILPLWKIRTHLSYTVKTVVADYLVTQKARTLGVLGLEYSSMANRVNW